MLGQEVLENTVQQLIQAKVWNGKNIQQLGQADGGKVQKQDAYAVEL